MLTDYPVWRYLDLPKFQSLLETSALFQLPIALAIPMKARSSHFEFEERQSNYSAAVNSASADWNERFLPFRTMVSSWHAAEHESKAMWDLYAGKGICIQSSRQALLRECQSGRTGIFHQPRPGESLACSFFLRTSLSTEFITMTLTTPPKRISAVVLTTGRSTPANRIGSPMNRKCARSSSITARTYLPADSKKILHFTF